MKNVNWLLFLVLLFPVLAFADTDPTQVTLPTGDALMQIIALIGGLKGATGLGLALVGGKILMAVLQSEIVSNLLTTKLGDVHGKWRFILVSLVTVALAVVAQMSSGQSFLAALLSGSVVTMASVYFNQAYKQFFSKAE